MMGKVGDYYAGSNLRSKARISGKVLGGGLRGVFRVFLHTLRSATLGRKGILRGGQATPHRYRVQSQTGEETKDAPTNRISERGGAKYFNPLHPKRAWGWEVGGGGGVGKTVQTITVEPQAATQTWAKTGPLKFFQPAEAAGGKRTNVGKKMGLSQCVPCNRIRNGPNVLSSSLGSARKGNKDPVPSSDSG